MRSKMHFIFMIALFVGAGGGMPASGTDGEEPEINDDAFL